MGTTPVERGSREELDRSTWDRFAATPSGAARDLLVRRYLTLLFGTARSVARQVPTLSHAEAVSAGFIGLSQAVDRFDPARGLSFSTFACPRIRGAILDDVRSQSPLPRQALERRRRLGRTRDRLAARNLRRPSEREVAGALGIPLSEYWSWHDQELRGRNISLEAPAQSRRGDARGSASEVIADPVGLEFSERVDRESLQHRVRVALATLPVRLRTAVEAYFLLEKPYREVGALLGVSTARACEIVQQGLARLRSELASCDPMPVRAGA